MGLKIKDKPNRLQSTLDLEMCNLYLYQKISFAYLCRDESCFLSREDLISHFEKLFFDYERHMEWIIDIQAIMFIFFNS